MEVFTDKLVAKIPSTASGVVTSVNYEDDDVAKVGHPLIVIEEEGEGEEGGYPASGKHVPHWLR